MNPLRQHIFPVAVLGFLAMGGLGWNLGGESGGKAATSAKGPSVTRSSGPRTSHGRRLSEDVEKRLAPLRVARNETERMEAAIGLASTIPVGNIAAWLDGAWFSQRKGAAATLFHKILLERWKQEDPDAFLAWSLKNRPGDAYNHIASIASTDPGRALDLLKGNPNRDLEFRLLSGLVKGHPELVLGRLVEMKEEGDTGRRDSIARAIIGQLAEQSPAELEAVLDSLPPRMKEEAEVALVVGKMSGDFSGEFRKLQDHPDGLDLFQGVMSRNAALRDKLPSELASLPASWKAAIANDADSFIGSDPEVWFRTDLASVGFTPQQIEDIRIEAMGPLIGKQPEEALRHLAEMGVPAQTRSNLLWNAFRELRDHPGKAEALLAMLDNEEDKDTAGRALGSDSNNNPPFVEQPSEWVEKVIAHDTEKGWPHQYVSMLGSWDQEKLAALGRQLGSLPEDQGQSLARILVDSRDVDSTLKGQAVRYLVSNPATEPPDQPADPFQERDDPDPNIRSIQIASRYIQSLARNDPAAAGRWLSTLPAGDARSWASKNLHTLWSGYDPGAADHWLKSLPQGEQQKIRQIAKK